jgi:ATP-dependent helicase/nuclease subunit B
VNATLLPAAASLIDEAARRIESVPGDFTRTLVVFPGKRPAHFLRQRLAEKQRSSFIPPRILSMDELVDELFEGAGTRQDGGPVTTRGPRLEPIDAVAILYEIQTAVATLRPLGGTAFMTLDSFFPIGMKIFGDLEELAIERVPARKVAEVQPLVDEEVPGRSRERLQSMAHFYEEFYKAVVLRGFSTRSSRYVAVAGDGELESLRGKELVLFAGFYALTSAEQALFKKLGSWQTVQFLFQDGPGMSRRLTALGVRDVPREAAPTAGPAAETRFYSSPDTHGQVFALNAALRKNDNGTLIVLPAPATLFPLLRHCLSRFDAESYNISLPYPLQRTPLYGFLNDLMELVSSMDGERVYLPDYISFVLHPYVKNIRLGASAEATRVLFHTLEERRAKRGTQRFATLEEIEGDEGLFVEAARKIAAEDQEEMAAALRGQLTDIHGRTVGRFRSFTSVRDFAERCIALITWVHDESTARDHPFFTAFAESFISSLDTIRRSLMAEMSFNDTGSYFLLLRRYLQTRHLPFPGTPLHEMQVLGTLETRNLRFDRVFVLDANEGALPEAGPESTLLPVSVRGSLGLSTYRDREDISAYHFAVLAAGARELHLFSVQNGEKERSRFAEQLLWQRQKAAGAREEGSLVSSISYRVSLSSRPPAAVAKTPEMAAWLRLREYSATVLDAYLRCPLKFYYKVVLRLGEREETAGGIEPADIGIFVHDILFRFFAVRIGRPLSGADADPAAMEALVEEVFAERFGAAESGANRMLLNQVRRHMHDFVQRYLGPLVREHRVTVRELEKTLVTSRKGFSLRGRLDSVQERDGVSFLLDYKTSSHRANYTIAMKKLILEDRSSWSAAIPTLQLPFYVLLHSADTGAAPTDIHAMFLLLGRTAMDKGIEAPLFDDPAKAVEGWPRLEAVIDGLLQEIVSPEIPFTPASDLKSACPYCEFAALCGTAWLAHRA